MDALQPDPRISGLPGTLVGVGEDLGVGRRDRITPRPAAQPLRCVSSGYLSHGCRCQAAVPAEVAAAACTRARAAGPDGEGFFRFVWRGGVWLAYAVSDGSVRGVYCPEHRAEREERSHSDLIVREALGASALATA